MRVTNNKYGVKVSMCCASCDFKESTRLLTQRHCTRLNKEVSPIGLCKKWKMSKLLKQLGSEQGQVKSREYLLYLTDVRIKEQELQGQGKKIVPKNIAKIRAEFEKEHGSIYINI